MSLSECGGFVPPALFAYVANSGRGRAIAVLEVMLLPEGFRLAFLPWGGVRSQFFIDTGLARLKHNANLYSRWFLDANAGLGAGVNWLCSPTGRQAHPRRLSSATVQ
jgi:hypothetical protein